MKPLSFARTTNQSYQRSVLSYTTSAVLIKCILAAVSLGYLVHYVDGELVASALRDSSLSWIMAASSLVAVNLFLEAWKWHLMVRRVDGSVRFFESFGAMMSGYALGFFTPARIGDYAGRAFYLRHSNKWELAAITFSERMLTLACYVGFGLLALAYFLSVNSSLNTFTWYLIAFASSAAFGTLLLLILHPQLAKSALFYLIPLRRVRELLPLLDRFLTRDAHYLLGLSALRYAVFTTQFLFLIWAFSPSLSILEAYVGIALVFFAKAAIPSLTLADLGIREGASIYFLGAFGVAGAVAFNASFLLFCVNILGPALIGIPFLMRLRLALRASTDPAAERVRFALESHHSR